MTVSVTPLWVKYKLLVEVLSSMERAHDVANSIVMMARRGECLLNIEVTVVDRLSHTSGRMPRK